MASYNNFNVADFPKLKKIKISMSFQSNNKAVICQKNEDFFLIQYSRPLGISSSSFIFILKHKDKLHATSQLKLKPESIHTYLEKVG